MIALLAFRSLFDRPWRSALLFLGYGIGVGVMVVLLAIGDALIAQARDERLVGGGEITVLPEGIDVEVMKTGGIGGLFFSIDHSRFIYRQLLASPRLDTVVTAAAPQITAKVLYLRPLSGGEEVSVRASGGVPSRDDLVAAAPEVVSGEWRDDDADRRWLAPTPAELRHELDRFHVPPAHAANPESWAEWHYFNVLSADRKRWAFISFIVGGDVRTERWGGKVGITLHEEGREPRRFSTMVDARQVRFSTVDANVALGGSRVTVLSDGRYAVRATAGEERGTGTVTVDLIVSPAPNAYFPGASLGADEFVSGYVVPALRADAAGRICVNGSCETYDGAQSYHDHNWGVWKGVTWDWGAARAGSYTLLYGRVRAPDADSQVRQPVFVYLIDTLGFLAVFRPTRIEYEDTRTTRVGGNAVAVPSRATFMDARGDDTVHVELLVEDAMATDVRTAGPSPSSAIGTASRRYFVQMKGVARLRGRINGRVLSGEGSGFFETYR